MPFDIFDYHCTDHSFIILYFIVAFNNIKKVLFKRMCAPAGQLTKMECIGLRGEENIIDFPQGNSFIMVIL